MTVRRSIFHCQNINNSYLKQRSSKATIMTSDTNTLSYWLHWRVFLCALWLLTSMAFASFLIWKYERIQTASAHVRTENEQAEGKPWGTCLKVIPPTWLLGFRIIAFFVLFSLIATNVATDGGGVFYFYTQWTFTLVTFYFGLGCVISIYGCCNYRDVAVNDEAECNAFVVEQDTSCIDPILQEVGGRANVFKTIHKREQTHCCQISGVCSYVFQVMFQICAGAVLLTDLVFWFLLYPLLLAKDHGMDFMMISMHSINAVFLIGDTILNNLRFPMFRIAYFVLWTGIFVIFQWTIHACVSLWWPYPFLDLSSEYAPLWYLAVGLMHVPCYGVFALIVRLKNIWLSRTFPESYQGH